MTVKMKATDTLHISSVQEKPILAGETFSVNEGDAKSLEDRKLAIRVGGAKAEAAPANKAEAAPSNKSTLSAATAAPAPAKRKA
jgi:hypothetical protein